MFNSIYGTITQKLSDSIYILSNGLEWDISAPGSDIEKLPRVGEEGRIFTWLLHREDQMKLYGFSSDERRITFLELLKVEGIGPRAALKILSGIDQNELEKALENEDIARLEAVPGLGKKTAQKMILALKGKLVKASVIPHTPYNDLAEALVNMGYDRRAAVEALAQAEKEIPANIKGTEREKLLFKEAIVYLSGNT
jgi:Holliday junction DNA helicase RuvA